MDRCDGCGRRIDTAVEEYTRLTSELICQHCMDEAWDVALERDLATSPTPKAQDSQKEKTHER